MDQNLENVLVKSLHLFVRHQKCSVLNCLCLVQFRLECVKYAATLQQLFIQASCNKKFHEKLIPSKCDQMSFQD